MSTPRIRRMVMLAAALSLCAVTFASEEKTGSAKRVGPDVGEPWFGVHVGAGDKDAIEKLIAHTPALAKRGVNVLIVEVNYGFDFQSHPELRGQNPITREQAQRLAEVCRTHDVRLIPQFQCLGHQSWAKQTHPLLRAYPQFDETPGQYPDNENIYCRSWCALHPEVNTIIFELFDELIDAFEADALHVGMDEVFLIGSPHCARCHGRDTGELFAKAVKDYHEHLVKLRGVEMLIWGDRLIDADATPYGRWEAADNGTHPAVDQIPTDIIICDWHYNKSADYPSIPMFIAKGFRVWPAGWNKVEATKALIDDAKQHDSPLMLGHLCTVWGAAKPDQLADWPPIQAAAERMRGENADDNAAP